MILINLNFCKKNIKKIKILIIKRHELCTLFDTMIKLANLLLNKMQSKFIIKLINNIKILSHY